METAGLQPENEHKIGIFDKIFPEIYTVDFKMQGGLYGENISHSAKHVIT